MKLTLLFGRLLRFSRPSTHPDYGIPTVIFNPALVTDSVKRDLINNIETLSDFGPEHSAELYSAALLAVSNGGDLGSLRKAIVAMGVDKRRAGQIASFLNHCAFSVIERERHSKLGIEDAIWVYSGAPCRLYPADYNDLQDEAHKRANGKKFRIVEGMLLNGKWTWPGREEGCKCVSRAVIPGF